MVPSKYPPPTSFAKYNKRRNTSSPPVLCVVNDCLSLHWEYVLVSCLFSICCSVDPHQQSCRKLREFLGFFNVPSSDPMWCESPKSRRLFLLIFYIFHCMLFLKLWLSLVLLWVNSGRLGGLVLIPVSSDTGILVRWYYLRWNYILMNIHHSILSKLSKKNWPKPQYGFFQVFFG